MPDDIDPSDYAVDCDPTCHFDVRHPFSGTALVQKRIWQTHRITRGLAASGAPSFSDELAPRYFFDVGSQKRSGNYRQDEFTTCELNVLAWEASSTSRTPVLSRHVQVSIRSWLPLRSIVPPPPSLVVSSVAALRTASRQLHERIDSMWFPHLPGINPWDIAENYAEYLGLRAVEEWARTSKLLPV